MRKMKKLTAYAAIAAMAISACPITSLAYGETTSKSTLIADTQGIENYQTWKEDVWTGKESADSGKIILTPGKTEKDLGLCWYSKTKGTPAVKFGKKADLSDGKVYEGKATAINRSNWKNTYLASNKVTLTGILEENTTYYYSYTDDVKASSPVWSEAKVYKTHGFDRFQTLLVGDPQVGASGSTGQGTEDDINIAVDTYNWNKTLTQAGITAPNASFILSAGDQVDYAGTDDSDTKNVRESEYAGFVYPEALRSLALATTIGNHESKGTDYQYHYNNPNTEDDLGSTRSGSDYYFSYGNTLIISLNSNNRNIAEHRELMKKALESHKDAKWKIVMFHHDIYGSGQPHSDTDGANLRIIFAPLMDEFDIDVCLTGHDHSYARTFQLIDGTAIDYGNSVALNPEGTLYIAAGSASGSKFYNLATEKQYYIAERSNIQYPTFSTLDITNEELTIRTYDYNGNKYADDFTLFKSEDKESLQSLTAKAGGVIEADYTKESYATLKNALTVMQTLLQVTDADNGLKTLSEAYDKSLDTDNPNDPINYYAYASGENAAEGTTRLKAGFSTLLDKTITTKTKLSKAQFEKAYADLNNSLKGLQKPEEPVKQTTSSSSEAKRDTTVISIEIPKDEPEAKLTLKVKQGKKTLKSSSVIKVKKGKSVKITATPSIKGKKVTFTSSNKKIAKVTSKGKITGVKASSKAVKITVKCGKVKKTFKVKVTK